MEDIFIKSIHINKVHHLENVNIPISETERNHLILTGKNGSGKTSVLLEIKKMLELSTDVENKFVQLNLKIEYHRNNRRSKIDELDKDIILGKLSPSEKFEIEKSIRISDDKIEIAKKEQGKFDLGLQLNTFRLSQPYNKGHFILSHFGAKRSFEINTPIGINKVETKEKYNLDENVGKNFLQHMVNLKADSSFARDDNDENTARQIDDWFVNFEKSLQEIFEDEHLRLIFQRNEYNFKILHDEKGYSDFTTLSDGYSAIFNIISELIMRMDSKASKSYDIQGIVLIDEVETHLHIDLQKKILPFLTSFFPKIQFIVTTHSPFVLNSIKNAVVFDLEKKILVEDMTGYSINSIVESYFDSDNYSTVVKEKVIEYENLLNKSDLNEEEEEKLFDLKRYFKDLPKMFSPELALKINQLTLANLTLK